MIAWGMTDRGIVRQVNQDAYYFDASGERAVVLVCDGMGGAKAGDVASKLALASFVAELQNGGSSMDDLLLRAVNAANSKVYAYSEENPEYAGMGTTLVGAIVVKDRAYVVNVGDSRCYCLNITGIEQVTQDHSVVAEMVRRGMLTPDQARNHPRKNLITRALGTKDSEDADVFHVRLAAGSVLLLCSDGLSNLLTDQELYDQIYGQTDLKSCCKTLIDLALERGAPDNVTVVLLKNDGALN